MKNLERIKETQVPISESGQSKRIEIGRREFLKKTLLGAMGGLAAFYFPELFAGKAEAIEGKEKLKEKTFEEVKKETIGNIRDNTVLRVELGSDNFEELIQMIEKVDVKKINQTIEKISGTPKEILEKKKIGSLRILSKEEWLKKSKSKPNATAFMGFPNHIFIPASEIMAKEPEAGKFKIDKSKFYNIFLHEYSHILTADHSKPASDGYPWEDEQGLTEDFYEGATELQSSLLLKELGLEAPEEYGYPGGNTLTAFLVSEAVGHKNFSYDYYRGKTDKMKQIFDKKFGEGSFETVAIRSNTEGERFILGNMDDLDALLDLVKIFEKKNVNYEAFLKKAKDLGITETVSIQKEGGKIDGVIDITYADNVQGVMVDSAGPLAEDNRSLRIRLLTGRGDIPSEFLYEIAAHRALGEISFDTNINLLSIPQFDILVKQYDFEKNPGKRRELREDMFNLTAQIGAEALVSIRGYYEKISKSK